jgi:hypothetical protein
MARSQQEGDGEGLPCQRVATPTVPLQSATGTSAAGPGSAPLCIAQQPATPEHLRRHGRLDPAGVRGGKHSLAEHANTTAGEWRLSSPQQLRSAFAQDNRSTGEAEAGARPGAHKAPARGGGPAAIAHSASHSNYSSSAVVRVGHLLQPAAAQRAAGRSAQRLAAEPGASVATGAHPRRTAPASADRACLRSTGASTPPHAASAVAAAARRARSIETGELLQQSVGMHRAESAPQRPHTRLPSPAMGAAGRAGGEGSTGGALRLQGQPRWPEWLQGDGFRACDGLSKAPDAARMAPLRFDADGVTLVPPGLRCMHAGMQVWLMGAHDCRGGDGGGRKRGGCAVCARHHSGGGCRHGACLQGPHAAGVHGHDCK